MTEFNLKQLRSSGAASSAIEYSLPVDSQVVLEVYDASGQKVITLVDALKSAGSHSLELGSQQKRLSTGTYYCRMAAYDGAKMKYVNVKKMLI